MKYRDRTDVEFAALEGCRGVGPGRLSGYSKDGDIVKAAVSGRPLTIAPEPPLETLYIEDFASEFVAALLAESLSWDRYILGSGVKASLEEIAEVVRREIPEAEIAFDPDADSEISFSLPVSDSTRLRDDVGWAPEYTVEEGVLEYIEWARENPEKWSVDPAAYDVSDR